MTSDSNSWRWSSTGTTSAGGFQNWKWNDPDNYNAEEMCVFTQNGSTSGLKEYIVINSSKTWSDSQSYCRQHYHDLATIESSAENQAVTDILPVGAYVWIGLYRRPFRWSDGSPSTYRRWRMNEPTMNMGWRNVLRWKQTLCGMMSHKSSIVRTKLTFQTTAAGLSESVRDSLLKALQNHFGSGFSLTWTVQPTKEEKKDEKEMLPCPAK
ncbi:hypothetical protein WMY93_026964 [Mugilogobius chulae]|uniref:C-type lectin domain-containing protein n=1 Tax=Mugilogobius chulae TaxID=88201 RepID=A0AAW0MUY1_9GOBI